MKAKITVACLLGTLMAGCSSGVSTPEDMAKQVIDAMNDTDSKTLLALMPEAKTVDKMVQCESRNPIQDEVDDFSASIEKNMQRMQEEGLKAEFVSLDELEIQYLKAGDDYRDCAVLRDFEMHRIRVNMNVITDSKTRERTGKLDTIKYGGSYYLVEL